MAEHRAAFSAPLNPELIPKLHIYFGSQTGPAERFANELAEEATNKGGENALVDLEDFSGEALAGCQMGVFLVATFGEGQPTTNAQQAHDWLKRKKKEQCGELLGGLRYCVFGLGSSHYEHFCAEGKYFDGHLAQLGGRR